MRTFKLPKCKRILDLSFTPDGRRLAAITGEVEDYVESVVWLDLASGTPERVVTLEAEFAALAPDHSRLAVAYSGDDPPAGRKLICWADLVKEEDPEWVDVPVAFNHAFTLAFTPDGDRLVAGGGNQARAGGEWRMGLHVESCSAGGSRVAFETEPFVGAIAFSADCKWMALSGGPGGDPLVRFHRYLEREPSAEFTPPATRTRRLLFAPDRPLLAALAGKQGLLLEPENPKPIAVLKGHGAQVNDAAFTPDGTRLFTVSHDGTVRCWMVPSGRAVGALDWSVGRVTAVAVAPDGLTAAAAGEKGQIVLWDVERS